MSSQFITTSSSKSVSESNSQETIDLSPLVDEPSTPLTPTSLSHTGSPSSDKCNHNLSVSSLNPEFVYSPFQRSFTSNIVLTEIACQNIPFIICDSPDNDRISEYIKIFKEKGVTDIARACKPKYDEGAFTREGICVHEFYFEDGGIPPDSLLISWLSLVYECEMHNSAYISSEVEYLSKRRSIAVHCVAGLGRAPLLVAIALVEFGMSPIDTIELVRAKRKGSLNSKQIRYLVDTYRPGRLYSPSRALALSKTLGTSSKGASCKNSSPSQLRSLHVSSPSTVSLPPERRNFFRSIFRMFS